MISFEKETIQDLQPDANENDDESEEIAPLSNLSNARLVVRT